jgi:hypothetical protein
MTGQPEMPVGGPVEATTAAQYAAWFWANMLSERTASDDTGTRTARIMGRLSNERIRRFSAALELGILTELDRDTGEPVAVGRGDEPTPVFARALAAASLHGDWLDPVFGRWITYVTNDAVWFQPHDVPGERTLMWPTPPQP